MTGRALLESALRELDNAGIADREVTYGRHVKLRWRGAGGTPRLVIISVSPSHRNAVNRVRADTRRLRKMNNRASAVSGDIELRTMTRNEIHVKVNGEPVGLMRADKADVAKILNLFPQRCDRLLSAIASFPENEAALILGFMLAHRLIRDVRDSSTLRTKTP